MPEERIGIVRRIYSTWAERGSPVPSGLLAPEIEWVNPEDAVEPGTRRGIEAFAIAVGNVNDAFEEPRIEFERFVEAGDKVAAIGTMRGRGRGSGVAFESTQAHVWTIRDGKAVRMQVFHDVPKALRAAGVDA